MNVFKEQNILKFSERLKTKIQEFHYNYIRNIKKNKLVFKALQHYAKL